MKAYEIFTFNGAQVFLTRNHVSGIKECMTKSGHIEGVFLEKEKGTEIMAEKSRSSFIQHRLNELTEVTPIVHELIVGLYSKLLITSNEKDLLVISFHFNSNIPLHADVIYI